MQLYETLSRPSSNHRMRASSSRSTSLIRVGKTIQSRRLACSAQKPSESSTERLYISRYFASSECADLANAGGTAKMLSGNASSDTDGGRGGPTLAVLHVGRGLHRLALRH